MTTAGRSAPTRAQLATLASVSRSIATGAARLAEDETAAEAFLTALNEGDSDSVGRIFGGMGVDGVTHQKADGPMTLRLRHARPQSDGAKPPADIVLIKIVC